MASFIDSKSREWTISICGPSIDDVREVDPQFLKDEDGAENNTASRLGEDPALLCHVIYTLCQKQREKRDVSLDEFYTEVIGDGEAIEAAGEALTTAIENFTPPRKREFIKVVAKKRKAVEELAMAKGLAKINDPNLDAQIEKMLDDAISKAFARLGNATDSPDSAESTPEA